MSDSGTGRRYWIPLGLFVFLLGAFFLINLQLNQQESAARLTKARVVAEQVASSLEVFAADRKRALANLLNDWPFSHPNPLDEFHARSQTIQHMLPGFANVVWADAQQIILWSSKENQRQALHGKPLDTFGVKINPPNSEEFVNNLAQNADGHYYAVIGRAISPQALEYGFVAASFDLRITLAVLVGEQLGSEFSYAMLDGNVELAGSGQFNQMDPLVQQPIRFADRDWILKIQSKKERVPIGLLVFAIGAFMSCLVCLILYRQLRAAFELSSTFERYQGASESSLDSIIIYEELRDDKGQIIDFQMVEANKRGRKIFVTEDFDFGEASLAVQCDYLELPELFHEVVKVAEEGQPFESQFAVQSSVVEPEWIKLQVVKAGHTVAITVRDVSEQVAEHEQLLFSEGRFRRLVDGLHGHFIYSLNRDGNIDFISSSVVDILGYEPDYFREHHHKLALKNKNDYRQISRQLKVGLRPEPYRIEYPDIHGETKIIEYRDSPVLDEQGRLIRVEGIGRDVTVDVALQEQVVYQANYDQLTGLFNRYAFDRELQSLLEKVQHLKGQAVLCFIDMDQFKLVNDTCGHPAGDELLRQVSGILGMNLSNNDILARVGGDEFCLVFADKTLEEAKQQLDKLLVAIADFRFMWDKHAFFIGASIGVVEVGSHANTVVDLISAADNACYRAKSQGRNRYYVYNPDDAEVNYQVSELELVNRIRQAIQQDEFELFHQPIVPLNSQSGGLHYEILLRLPDGKNGYVSPAEFIPVSERHGLMSKIDIWVFEHTMDLLERHPQHVAGLSKCAINLSGLSIGDDKILDHLIARLKRSVVPSEKICFEITETAAVTNLAAAARFIQSLRDVGAKFALDDFGAGMSSFTYLKNMSVDYVKIDGSFVRNMCCDKSDFAAVKAIHEIAQSMGKQTIAEFVSDEIIKGCLSKLGVTYGQGFGLGKPSPFKDLLNHSDQS